MSLLRRTFGRMLGRSFRGRFDRKSRRKIQVSTADLAASVFPTPRLALATIPVHSPHRRRRHRNAGYAAGPGGRRIFRVT